MPLGRVLTVIFLIGHGAVGTSQEPKKPAPAWERRDILGRPIPWGEEVGGQRVCLWIPAPRLLYGQPIDVMLRTAQATDDPPHLELNWEGPQRTVFFRMDGSARSSSRLHAGEPRHGQWSGWPF